MTQRQLMDSALKLFSLYFLVKAVLVLIELLFYVGIWAIQDTDNFWVVLGTMFISLLSNILFFWIFAFKSISILPLLKIENNNRIENKASLKLTKVDCLEMGIVLIGIIAITFAIPEILFKGADSIYFQREPSPYFQIKDTRPELLYALFKAIVGLIVVSYARQMSKAIIRRGEKDDLLDVNQNTIEKQN